VFKLRNLKSVNKASVIFRSTDPFVLFKILTDSWGFVRNVGLDSDSRKPCFYKTLLSACLTFIRCSTKVTVDLIHDNTTSFCAHRMGEFELLQVGQLEVSLRTLL
jgi:hypothetical protein